MGEKGIEWKVKSIPVKRSHTKALNILTSKSWIDCSILPTGRFELPFIDRWGKFTGTSIYSCNMLPQQAIATIVSTIFRRLKFWVLSHKCPIHKMHIRQDLLLRVAALYAFTKNTYFMNRIIFLLKNLQKNYKTISSIAHNFATKIDNNTWFVFCQVCSQTNWLTSRALRPRDKSIIIKDYFFRERCITSLVDQKSFCSNSVWNVFVKMFNM